MAAPNTEVGSIQRYLGDTRTDGTLFLPSGIARSNPMQAMIQGYPLATMVTYSANGGALSAAAANACAGQALTCFGLLTTDFVLAVHKPTNQAGLTMAGAYANAANSLTVNFSNPTAANVTPTANEAYNATVVRGLNTVTANVSVANFVNGTNAPGMTETTVTLGGSGASVTPNISSTGGVTSYNVVVQGSGYTSCPTVVITGPAGSFGATAVAVISGGAVVSVIPTTFGSGYVAGQTFVTLSGGNTISTGMIGQVNYPVVANMGVGNVRVVGNNQIAFTSFSLGTANVSPTANASTIFGAFNEMPAASATTLFGFTAPANWVVGAANSTTNIAITVPGILTTDVAAPFAPVGALMTANLVPAASAANAANTLTVSAFAGVAAANGAAGQYVVPITRQAAVAPMAMWDLILTPAACAANTATEQIFTLPSGVTLSLLQPILVNMQNYIQGCTISTNGRANSTTTLGVTFINNTANSITPPANTVFRVAQFPALIGTITANTTAFQYYQTVGIGVNQTIDLLNEIQTTLDLYGIIKGM